MWKSVYLLILIVIITLPLLSQNINQVDDSGRKQGKWLKAYTNGNTRYQGQFRNDRPYGTFFYYYESGEKEGETNFSDDGIIAHAKTFYTNGKLRAEGKYISQKKDSLWKFYSEIDSKLIAEENYRLGILEGSSIIYYPEEGKPAEVTEYKAGLKSGKQQKFFTDGKLMSESNYKKDELSGEFKSYHPNGNIQIKGNYLNGLQQGNWTYYDENGNELSEEQYKEQAKVKSNNK